MDTDTKKFGLSKLTIGLAVFIILSASFTRYILNFLYKNVGKNNLQISAVLVFAVVGVLFVGYLIKASIPKTNLFIIIVLLLSGLVCSQFIKIVEERIHILEYGLLGWLAVCDVVDKQRHKTFLYAGGFVFLVGMLDEGFQYILPNRVCDIRDVVFNTIGGLWGIILRILKS
ncbi:MAG: VanZ family protein [Elusimicrobiota bacterium]